ncbi:MAG: anti-sigma factor family protein [Limisphaerales bacterium]
MNCRRFEEELEKLGTLKALETDAALREHLNACSDCQTKRLEYVRVFEMLKADQPSMPDDAYWASFPALVRERIEKAKSRPRWKPVLGWSLPAAALILVVGIAFFVSKEKPNLANLTTEQAFSYAEVAPDTAADIPLPENTLTSVTAQAEDELVGTLKVEELVYTLSEDQLKTLEEKLTNFKL